MPIRLSGVKPRVARIGAAMATADWGSVSRCQPNAAPFFLATFAAIGWVVAPVCSDNEHFLGGGSVFYPVLRAVNSTMTGRRDDSMHAHSEDA